MDCHLGCVWEFQQLQFLKLEQFMIVEMEASVVHVQGVH